MIEIPLLPWPNQELMIVLNGQNCYLHVFERGSRLYLSLRVGSTLIRQGASCLPKQPILSTPNMFKGQLYIYDSSSPADKQANPAYSGLGTRFKLVYLTPAEVESLG